MQQFFDYEKEKYMRETKLIALLLAILLTGCAARGARHADSKDASPTLAKRAAETMAPAPAPAGYATMYDLPPPAPKAKSKTGDADGDAVQIQTVEFRSGVSSATVEKMAQGVGCKSGKGAALLTNQGPIEVYRLACGDGTTFMARCELRQCRSMR